MAKGILSLVGKKGKLPPYTLEEVKRDNEFNLDRAQQIGAIGELLSAAEIHLNVGTMQSIGNLVQDLARAIADNLTVPAPGESELEEEAAQ